MGPHARRLAIKMAIANNALSGFTPSQYGMSVYEKWIAGLDGNASISLMKVYHQNLETTPGATSDNLAKTNLLGITDGARMRSAEADITTLRLAELLVR